MPDVHYSTVLSASALCAATKRRAGASAPAPQSERRLRVRYFELNTIGIATHTGTFLSRFSAGENCIWLATVSAAWSSAS